MRAITLQQNGGIENLVLAEVAKPAIAPGEVLVQVKAISINPVDAFVRRSEQALLGYVQPKPGEKNIIIGWDISGVITEVGPEVSGFKTGDAVFGMVNFKGAGKAYAEYVAAPAHHLALKPANVSHEEAAGATLAALTAWQALVVHGKVKSGEKVLIHAAAGGVGHYAVQIAKHLGAYVIGTASAVNRDFVLSLGADEFIDYTRERFEEKVTDADMVLEALPADHVEKSLKAVKRGGRIVSLLAHFDESLAQKAVEKGVMTQRPTVSSNGDDMKAIAALLEKGQLHSHISQTFRFEDLPKAHLQIETGRTRGKIVVQV